MSYQASLSKTVSPYLLWFLLHKSQTGISMLNFQHAITPGAGHDAWISVLVTGLSIHVVVLLIFYILKHASKGDIISLHVQLFGKWLGSLLNGAFLLYLLMLICFQLISYSQVIQTLVFPEMKAWRIALVFLLMFVYIVRGGFRVITGITFCFVLIPSLLIVTLIFPLQYAEWRNFLPFLNHTLPEFTYSASRSVPLYMGVELLLIYFPYIRDNAKSAKWAHIGVLHTYVLYLIIACTTFAFYNQGEIKHEIWPTLSLSKIISFTFLERFDYFYIFNWVFAITPPCCIVLWGCTRILRSSTSLSAKTSLWIVVIVVFIIVAWPYNAQMMQVVEDCIRYAGSILLYGYIPLLAVCVFISNRLQIWRAERAS
ncbi:spore germination protein (amino acid permease) [Paenibacillus taihuensis]|uniref:Spore germination protein (Amino acid permease) n=1 Tax=Paenibacillus taihuensis TaxID=1156355 RepID=A0A3D9RMC3_9BACL|nr:GerAB/ArcD/ProY family transporter [Paenibacillus taihuensis]REE81043.1 spore germination protein (amino acid permease) [Paenibacillus taihuensis]